MTSAVATRGSAILALARAFGVRVEPDGPNLRVVAPPELAEADWAEIVRDLTASKAEVLDVLTGQPMASRSASWETLRDQRWGPAIGDETPGIVVTETDHDKIRAVLTEILDPNARGDADETGLDDFPSWGDVPGNLINPTATRIIK